MFSCSQIGGSALVCTRFPAWLFVFQISFSNVWPFVAYALFALIRVFVHVGFGLRFVVVKLRVDAKFR